MKKNQKKCTKTDTTQEINQLIKSEKLSANQLYLLRGFARYFKKNGFLTERQSGIFDEIRAQYITTE